MPKGISHCVCHNESNFDLIMVIHNDMYVFSVLSLKQRTAWLLHFLIWVDTFDVTSRFVLFRKTNVWGSKFLGTVITVYQACRSRCQTTPKIVWKWVWICVKPLSKYICISFSLRVSGVSNLHSEYQAPISNVKFGILSEFFIVISWLCMQQKTVCLTPNTCINNNKDTCQRTVAKRIN